MWPNLLVVEFGSEILEAPLHSKWQELVRRFEHNQPSFLNDWIAGRQIGSGIAESAQACADLTDQFAVTVQALGGRGNKVNIKIDDAVAFIENAEGFDVDVAATAVDRFEWAAELDIGILVHAGSIHQTPRFLSLTIGGTRPKFTHMDEYNTEQRLDNMFTAMADPTRRAILVRLTHESARVTELARDFPISLNSTSKHIKILERAGLISRTVNGRDHVLTLNAGPLAEAAQWVQHFQHFWDERLAALDQLVSMRRSGAKGKGDG